MSYFDDASLVMIPSGTKTSKVYSVKPIDGTGDLTFTRSNDTATRVASNGLIEKVRTNVLLHSQTLDNAVWSLTTATITANATAAPDGTTTAEKLIPAAAADPAATDASQLQQIIAVASNTYTFSIYAKAAGQNSVRIRENNIWGNFLNLNLTTGVANIIGGNFGQFNNVQVETLANGWYRLSFTTEAGVTNFSKYSIRGGETGDGTSGVFLWGAQLEVSDFGATPYIATTTAAVSVGPVANVPRLDYLNSTCPRLLLEPQRTNLATYSEQLGNAAWTKTNATISANVATSPAGFADADKLIDNATLAGHFIQQTISITGAHTFSVFAKASESSVITLQVQQTSVPSNFALIYYDLISGQVESGDFSTSLAAGTIQEMGNGWYRCTITYTPITAGTHNVRVFVAKNIGGNKVDYVGNGTDGVFLYGCQLEAGAYATSYIPTTTASVTRGVDLAVDTAASSLIGQTEGTIYAEVNFDSNVNTEGYIVRLDDTSFNDTIIISRGNDKRLNAILQAGGSTIVNIQQDNFNGLKRVAFAYKSGSFAVYVDGVQVGTSAATYTNGITYGEVRIGGFDASTANMSGGISKVLLFKTRLTNAQLAELTTI